MELSSSKYYYRLIVSIHHFAKAIFCELLHNSIQLDLSCRNIVGHKGNCLNRYEQFRRHIMVMKANPDYPAKNYYQNSTLAIYTSDLDLCRHQKLKSKRQIIGVYKKSTVCGSLQTVLFKNSIESKISGR